jgi:cyclic pyranopterin monophosphate synthase
LEGEKMTDINIRMADVSEKAVTVRQAIAKGRITMKAATLKAVQDARLPKGDALATAKIAGILAAKETPRLIPMCHPLLIEEVQVDFTVDKKRSAVEITCMVKGSGKTGYEMEALTALSVSALTIYDMCKSLDTSLKIEDVRLVRKSGGKSGTVILE